MTVTEVLAALARADCSSHQTGPRQWMARCPAHDDRKASLAVTEGRDREAKLYCHAGCSFVDIRDALGLERSEPHMGDTPPVVARKEDAEPGALPSEAIVKQWSHALLSNEKALTVLRETRGWSKATLEWLEIGYNGSALTIPHRNASGRVVNVAQYRPGRDPKMIVTRGRSRDLYPAPESFPPYVPLWIVEGEPDSISACELGMNATGIPGVQGWKPEWAARFAGRRVLIAMDSDAQGRQAAAVIETDLKAAGVRTKRHEYDSQRTDGSDLTDLLLDAVRGGGNTLEVVRGAMGSVLR